MTTLAAKAQRREFDVGGVHRILGVRPSGGDFAPGTFHPRVRSNTGAALANPCTSHEIWSCNNEDRANPLTFVYSTNNSSYTAP